ncbi:MAG: helix-turn-helix domain-containing protein [Chitinophagaceae bacterium]
MKKFTLTTEYSEQEIVSIIEHCIQQTLKQELQKHISSAHSLATRLSSKLLTRKELRRILRISYPTISRLTKNGTLKAKVVGGSYRYSESSIIKYLDAKS